MNKIIVLILAIVMIMPFNMAYRQVWDIYYPKDDTINAMKSMCDNLDHCEFEIIGQSYKGKNLYMFKLGNSDAQNRILMDGSMHGWEDSGTVWMMEFMEETSRSNSEEYKLLEHNYMLFIPIVNMDSVERNNARRYNSNGQRICCGVDINRNFATQWSQAYSSDYTRPYPVTYKGAYSNSEPETKAVINIMERYKPHVYINWHMGGEYTWAGCGNTELMDQLNLHSNCGAGFAITHARTLGAKLALYTETERSDRMPDTMQEFLNAYYERDLDKVQDIIRALGVPEPVEEPPIEEVLDCSVQENRITKLEQELSNLQEIIDSIMRLLE